MGSFLEVNEGFLRNKLLVSDNEAEAIEPEFVSWPTQPEPRILTPSERREAEQCKFVIPTPGLCIKTHDKKTGKKYFVNLCHSDDVPEPRINLADHQLADILDGGTPNDIDDIRLPMSIGEKRNEADKAGVACFACDIIVNTRFFQRKIMTSDLYQTFLIILAFEGVDEKHKMDLDKNGFRVLKNIKAYGKLAPQFLRSKAGIREVDSDILESRGNKLIQEVPKGNAINLIIFEIDDNTAGAEAKFPASFDPKLLEVLIGEDRIIVNSPFGPTEVYVPFDMHQEECRAEFDKTTSTLSLTLPYYFMP